MLSILVHLVQFSHSVLSDSLWSHGLQEAKLPCPSPTAGAYSNSCPTSRCCHPTIWYSVIPFSSWLQSFPTSGSFLVSQFFASGGQSIGVSASASVLPMNIQDWFPLELTDLISLQSKGLTRVFSNTTVLKHQFFGAQLSLQSSLTSLHDYWKTIVLTTQTFVGKVMSLIFNRLSRFVITFLPRSKNLLNSWLQSLSSVMVELKKIKSVTVLQSPNLFVMKWWDWTPWSSFLECWVLSQLFHSPLSLSSRGSLDSLHLIP